MKDSLLGWEKVKFGAIIECLDNERVPLNSEERYKMQGDIPYYGANGQLDSINQFIFNDKLLLLAEDGGSWGKKERCTYIIKGISWVNNHAHVLRIKKSIDITYLIHFLNFSDLNKYITGSTRGKLNRESMEKIEVTLPPLPTQKKIAAILEKAERLKEWRKEADRLTDEFLKSTFLEMFGDPAKNPMGWNKRKIGEIAEVKTGGTPNRKIKEYWDNGTIPWAKTTEVKENTIHNTEEYISESGLRNSNATLFPVNSILIAMYGQGKTRGRCAKLGISATTNQAFAAILPSENYIDDYLLNYLTIAYEELRNCGRGRNQPNLNLSIVKNFKICLPPIDIQEKYSNIIHKIEHLREHQSQSNQHIDDLFNSLMQKAFKGELAC